MSQISPLDIAAVQQALRAFADERDWQQFHGPKNLVMALSAEVGELAEVFQWLSPAQSAAIMTEPKRAQAVRDELADVLNYVLRIADVLDIDLHDAVWAKIANNAAKYPVELARGRADKYTDFAGDADS